MLVERQAQGFLTANRFKDGRDLWLLGTGTGLAPYISMLRDPAVWTQFAHIVLVVSVRERGDLGYVHEIESMAQESADNPAGRARLAFVTTVTREASDAGCLNGRIPALIESGQLEKAAALGLSDADSRFMLCGNPQMVEAMRTLLKSRGYRMNRKLEPGHIIVENYW
jgi:ferredoxin--NADP+ reductase